MRVAVPTRLAGAGDGDNVLLRKDEGGQGKEKLKLGAGFQAMFGFCSESSIERGG